MFEKKRGKRFLASVMALVMLLSLAPVGALAVDDKEQNQDVVALPADGDNQQAVADTPKEDTPTPQPAVDPKPVVADPVGSSSEAVILTEGDPLDQDFSVNPPEPREPSTQYERLYVTILNGTEFPNEPGFSHKHGYDFVKQSGNGGYSIEAYDQTSYSSNQQVFSTQAGNFIKVSDFNAADLTTNGNVTGLYNANGIDLTEYTNFTEENANAIAAAYASYKKLDTSATYKLVPYVLKYENHGSGSDFPSTGYHLDCIVVKNETVLVKYNINGATTSNFQLPDNTYVTPGSDVDIGSWKDSSGTTVADNSITAQKDGKDVTFVGWSTNPNEASNSENLYQAGASLQNISEETTLYAIWKEKEEEQTTPSTDTVDAKYFVLMPSMGTPTSGADQGPKNYFPNNSDNGGVVDCDAGSGYEGKISASVITKHAKADTKTGYFVAAGVESKYLSVPSDLGYFNSNPAYTGAFPDTLGTGFTMQGKQIVWYVIKNEGTKNEPDYHVDGYLAGIPVELRYHENFNFSGTDNNADLVKTVNKRGDNNLLSGDTVTIEGSTIITNQHPGWTFVGWTENRDGSGTPYKAGNPKVMMDSCELYAKWEKTYTVNFIGNGGVWDSSVSGYTMTTEDGKNIKATKPITVTPMTESTATVSKIATDPTKADQDFLGWSTTTNGECITDWTSVKLSQLADNSGQVTFYAQWKSKDTPSTTAKYTVKHHKWDTQKKEYTLADTDVIDSTVGADVTATAKRYDGGYILNEQKSAQTMSGTVLEDNTLTLELYYDVDKIGKGENLDQPDGIIDRYQVTIIYRSSDEDKGTVSTKKEVLTIKKDDEKIPVEDAMIKGSKATDNGGRNYFSNWTDEVNKQTINDATLTAETIKKAIKTAEGGETYTFTANFGKRSSSGGSSRPSTPTVTIPDDVPTGLNGKDHYAYIIGYGNNDVRPQNNITRAEVATIFFRLLTDETRTANMTKSNGYNDVKNGDWFCCAVSTLSKMGIIKGYEDGSFKPNDPISRAEFAAIAARFDPDGDKTPATFFDVTSHWAKDEISIAANHGWIKGYEDGSFKPDQKITRAETMTLVNRVLNRLPETKDDLHKDMKTWVDNMDETAWYYLAVQEATNSHYFKNKTGTKFEQWTDLRDTRDWSELEK